MLSRIVNVIFFLFQRGSSGCIPEETIDSDASKNVEMVGLEEANQDLREEVDRLTTELQSATGYVVSPFP